MGEEVLVYDKVRARNQQSLVLTYYTMNESHCYIISYDLCIPGRDYNSLYQALKRFEKWGKLTESTWAVVSNMNHVQIRDHLMQNARGTGQWHQLKLRV